jgi:hypothetical protein
VAGVKRLRCQLRTVAGTVTMGAFWRSLAHPPLVVFSGHVWPYPPAWSAPMPSPHPEDWPGLVEFDDSQCVDCGYREMPQSWRRFYS